MSLISAGSISLDSTFKLFFHKFSGLFSSFFFKSPAFLLNFQWTKVLKLDILAQNLFSFFDDDFFIGNFLHSETYFFIYFTANLAYSVLKIHDSTLPRYCITACVKGCWDWIQDCCSIILIDKRSSLSAKSQPLRGKKILLFQYVKFLYSRYGGGTSRRRNSVHTYGRTGKLYFAHTCSVVSAVYSSTFRNGSLRRPNHKNTLILTTVMPKKSVWMRSHGDPDPSPDPDVDLFLM